MLTHLSSTQPEFPSVEKALTEPNGLLAVGGNLSSDTLISAYEQGIFPWYDETSPLLWWSPDPRAVLFPGQLLISKSLKKTLNKAYKITFDQQFSTVIHHCAAPRKKEKETWITQAIQEAYLTLHQQGLAHSLEVHLEGQLVGGLYGLSLGRAFFGESMFHLQRDASKVAFSALASHLFNAGYHFIDCQVPNSHLESLGVGTIRRSTFIHRLNQALSFKTHQGCWGKSPP